MADEINETESAPEVGSEQVKSTAPEVDPAVRLSETYRMADIPPELKSKMRSLSLGPIAWGFWTWTFHDGSCWAKLIFDGAEDTPENLVGWASLTKETDVLPVIGCFISESHRKTGRGRRLITGLLQDLLKKSVLGQGDAVFNSSQRWSSYKEIIESCGLRPLTWL